MIWKLSEIIAFLSKVVELAPDGLILTGTPSGVGPVSHGDALEGRVGGLPPLRIEVI